MNPLNILQINKVHYPYGGVEQVYLGEIDLLRAAGHAVSVFSTRHPDNLPAGGDEGHFARELIPIQKAFSLRGLTATRNYLWSPEARKQLRALLRERKRFDVAHLHYIFRYLSPSIIAELSAAKIPMVMTLHDYKVVCGAGYLQYQNEICERCSQGRYLSILKTRCCQDSLPRSGFTYVEMMLHHRILKILDRVALFISPSEFHAQKIIEMGFRGKLRVIPNPIRLAPMIQPYPSAAVERIVFIGRLSPEKGADLPILALAQLASELPSLHLTLCGDGPLRDELSALAQGLGIADRVSFTGHLDREGVEREIAAAAVVIVPSRNYESQCLTILEAYGGGRPVIGSDLGALKAQISVQTGLVFKPGDAADLATAIRRFFALPQPLRAEMGLEGRKFAERHGDPARHLASLSTAYEEVIAKA